MQYSHFHRSQQQTSLVTTNAATNLYSKAAYWALAFILGTAMAIAAPAMAKPHAAAELGDVNVNDGFAELVRLVRPAVVNISVTGNAETGSLFEFREQAPELEEFFRRFFGDQFDPPEGGAPRERKTTAVGSGFIVDPTGLIVTNHHVVADADEIEVVFEDGVRAPAMLKGSDPKTDLALLQINTERDLPYVIFGDSDEAEVGDWVVAIGNPFGLGGTTTSGIISARGRDIRSGPLDDFIQIDASLNRGNSGGPLFNIRGEVIGVNSAIYSPSGGSIGIGFAIPSSMVSNVIAQLRESGTVERGYLGIHIQSLTEEIASSLGLDDQGGALITEVLPDTAAARAKLEVGDVILKYDGTPLKAMRDLPKLVALTEQGQRVDIEIWRDGKAKTIQVEVGGSGQSEPVASAAPSPTPAAELGLKLANLTAQTANHYGIDEAKVGVIIVDVAPGSTAAGRGLRAGDLIKRIDKVTVRSTAEAHKAIADSATDDKESILLLVERNNHARFVVVPRNES